MSGVYLIYTSLSQVSVRYWRFFSSPEAASVVEDHLESFFTVLYPKDESQFKGLFGNHEAMQEYVKADKKQPTQNWMTDEMRTSFIERFKRDGFTGPFNWYKAIVFNHHWNHDKGVSSLYELTVMG